jgi:pimeloyl-ACP methyl ester carboxylesterase
VQFPLIYSLRIDPGSIQQGSSPSLRWTPLKLSEPFLSRVKKVPVKIVELGNAGHYPMEEPGLQQMSDAIIAFLKSV